jgi:hypothetical protein
VQLYEQPPAATNKRLYVPNDLCIESGYLQRILLILLIAAMSDPCP